MLATLAALTLAMNQTPHLPYHDWAKTPPMGWNSWDCFGTTVTEEVTKAHADVMAAKLKKFGWEYVVVDIQWFEPNAKGFDYRKDAVLTMDENGRLLPAPNRFPSGFKKLGEYIHSKGLKFGIHMLRGVPRQAVNQKCPLKGSKLTCADIADTSSTCPWNGDMYGVDMTKPDAQLYYDSVFAQAADWGIDFVKVDDISRPYHQSEVEAIRKAIDKSGRPIVLSLSPGETPLTAQDSVAREANMWRISDDFWDSWPALKEQFERCRKWAPVTGPGRFPDADMLPLGHVRFGEQTHFTPTEQQTMMTLWAMFRSPLMLGCDLRSLDDQTLALITNPDVIAVNQHSTGGHQLFNRDGLIAWVADVPRSKDLYLALFNTHDAGDATMIEVSLSDLGFAGACVVRDLWTRKTLANASGLLSFSVRPRCSELLRVSLH